MRRPHVDRLARPLRFVTGGTGFVGCPLINRLERGHTVRALVRATSAAALAACAVPIVGNALDVPEIRT